jgi:polysaccharide biosynthesis transport protein
MKITPYFTTSMAVAVNTRKIEIIDLKSVISGLQADAAAIQGEISVITSRQIIEKVVNNLNLTSDPEFNPELQVRSVLFDYYDQMKNFLQQFATLDDSSNSQKVHPRRDNIYIKTVVTNNVLNNLQVTNDGRSNVIVISFTSHVPEKAALITNAIADAYLMNQTSIKRQAVRSASKWLANHLTRIKKEAKDSEQLAQNFREKAGLVESNQGTVTSQQLSEVNTQLVLAQAERGQLEARLRMIQDMVVSANVNASPDILSSASIQRLKEQESDLVRSQAELSRTYGSLHPRIIKSFGPCRASLTALKPAKKAWSRPLENCKAR